MFVFRLPLGFAVPHHKIAFDNVAVIAAAACERGLGERVVAVEWVLLLAVWAGRAAQWEHTVAIVPGGVWVLTAPDGGEEGLAPFGISPRPLPERG